MTVEETIAAAESVLSGEAAPEGEIDPRWQAIVAVGEFIEEEPEAVWSFIVRHCDDFISRVEEATPRDRLFAEMTASCWKFGKSEKPDRAARLDRLIASIRPLR